MHAINGTVGDPQFKETDVEVYEITLTIRFRKDALQDPDGEMAGDLALGLMDITNDMFVANLRPEFRPEVGVRGRRL